MAGILQISEATSLALHSMALMAEEEGLFSVKEIAHKINASEAHLSKVLQRLVKADLVQSVRGPKGGFTLAKPGGEVRLLDIYEAIEGPLGVECCLLNRDACLFNRCLFDGLLEGVTREVKNYMATKTLKDLIKE